MEMIDKRVSRFCAAFFYGSYQDLVLRGGGPSFIEQQGTMTFIRLGGCFFGVTNEHCLGPLDRRDGDIVYQVALQEHKAVPKPPLFESTKENSDFPFDIAIFRLHEEFLASSSKEFYDLELATEAVAGQMLHAVGFPGHGRRDLDDFVMEHRALRVVGACQGVSDRNINLRDVVPNDLEEVDLRGMSGGPVFIAGNGHGLVGISYEHASDIREFEEGTKAVEVNLLAFPFGAAVLRNMLGRGMP